MKISLGRIAAIVAVAGMTALPFVSCSAGPMKLEFKGHEILRNSPPAVDEKSGFSSKDKDKKLFEGSDQWLHWVFLAAALAAIASIFLVRKAAVATAVVGLVAVVVFLFGFNSLLQREMKGKLDSKGDKDAVGMSLEIGAYLALAGLAAAAVDAAVDDRRRRSTG